MYVIDSARKRKIIRPKVSFGITPRTSVSMTMLNTTGRCSILASYDTPYFLVCRYSGGILTSLPAVTILYFSVSRSRRRRKPSVYQVIGLGKHKLCWRRAWIRYFNVILGVWRKPLEKQFYFAIVRNICMLFTGWSGFKTKLLSRYHRVYRLKRKQTALSSLNVLIRQGTGPGEDPLHVDARAPVVLPASNWG